MWLWLLPRQLLVGSYNTNIYMINTIVNNLLGEFCTSKLLYNDNNNDKGQNTIIDLNVPTTYFKHDLNMQCEV